MQKQQLFFPELFKNVQYLSISSASVSVAAEGRTPTLQASALLLTENKSDVHFITLINKRNRFGIREYLIM